MTQVASLEEQLALQHELEDAYAQDLHAASAKLDAQSRERQVPCAGFLAPQASCRTCSLLPLLPALPAMASNCMLMSRRPPKPRSQRRLACCEASGPAWNQVNTAAALGLQQSPTSGLLPSRSKRLLPSSMTSRPWRLRSAAGSDASLKTQSSRGTSCKPKERQLWRLS